MKTFKSDKEFFQHWAQQAIQVQNACNLSGVVHSLSEFLSAMIERGHDNNSRDRHPISKLFADKIASLAEAQSIGGFDYGNAFGECEMLSKCNETGETTT